VCRRRCWKRLCTGGSNQTPSCGPSTSPLVAMSKLSTLTIVSVGFCAGFLFVAFVTSALRMLYSILGKGMRPSQPFPPKRTLWALPLLLLQPGLWILIAIPYFCYLVYSGRMATEWAWSIAGFFLSIAYMILALFWAMRRAKRKRARAVSA
jgi:hypothetical protein